jgi:DNA-binding transcriptional ArsR family regulator
VDIVAQALADTTRRDILRMLRDGTPQSLTSSDSTARWIGPWRGEPGVGRTCQLQMLFEQGEPWCDFVKDHYLAE